MAAIPVDDLPRETTLFNHLLDELEQFTPLANKITKSREAPAGSHRRTTKWLWGKVDLFIELERVKANRHAFDKKLRDSQTADLATTYNPKLVTANPAAKEGKEPKPKRNLNLRRTRNPRRKRLLSRTPQQRCPQLHSAKVRPPLDVLQDRNQRVLRPLLGRKPWSRLRT